jgi:hypothetical protein
MTKDCVVQGFAVPVPAEDPETVMVYVVGKKSPSIERSKIKIPASLGV